MIINHNVDYRSQNKGRSENVPFLCHDWRFSWNEKGWAGHFFVRRKLKKEKLFLSIDKLIFILERVTLTSFFYILIMLLKFPNAHLFFLIGFSLNLLRQGQL